MKDLLKCRICSSSNFSTLDTYKHLWLTCLECGNIRRERKQKYFMENILNRNFVNGIKPELCRELYHIENIVNDETNMYTYYSNIIRMWKSGIKYKIWEKWDEDVNRKFDMFFRNNNLNISNKNILSISGEPGFNIKHLSEKCKYAVVTGFSDDVANVMRDELQVNAIKYDYNLDSLTDIVDRKFDIVLIEYSINFCNDLNKLAKELFSIMATDGIIYISFIPPTLGCCLRWQHDEYTNNNLYIPESLSSIFNKSGFYEMIRDSEGDFIYTKGWSGKFGIHRKFWAKFYLNKISKNASINRELIQKNRILVFKKIEN